MRVSVTQAELIAGKIAEATGAEETVSPGLTVEDGKYYLVLEGKQKLIVGELYSKGVVYTEGEIYVI